MATPDSSKKQRITNFDFSKAGAHVALVDQAANGVEDFLVLKNFGDSPVTKVMEIIKRVGELHKKAFPDYELPEVLKLTAQTPLRIQKAFNVNMPLGDLLDMLGIWPWEARIIEESLVEVEEVDELDEFIDDVANEIKAMMNLGSSSDGAPDAVVTVVTAPVLKSNEDDGDSNMSKEDSNDAPKLEDVLKQVADLVEVNKAQAEVNKAQGEKLEALETANTAQTDKLAVFETVEKARVQKRLEDQAEKYSALGFELETHVPVLKGLEAVEGCELIFKALDAALDIVKNADKLTELGDSGEPVTSGNFEKLQSIAKSLMAEDPSLTMPMAITKAANANLELTD